MVRSVMPGLILLLLTAAPLSAADLREQLSSAARRGDVEEIAALLDRGVDVNAATDYGATALWFAASKDRLDAVTLLLKRKAAVNVRDTVWGDTPLTMAATGKNLALVRVL